MSWIADTYANSLGEFEAHILLSFWICWCSCLECLKTLLGVLADCRVFLLLLMPQEYVQEDRTMPSKIFGFAINLHSNQNWFARSLAPTFFLLSDSLTVSLTVHLLLLCSFLTLPPTLDSASLHLRLNISNKLDYFIRMRVKKSNL